MNKVFINDKPLYITTQVPQHINSECISFSGRSSLIKAIEFLYKSNADELFITHSNIKELQESFLKELKYVEAAGGIVKNEQDELLFILRHNKWDLPKGKAEAGENIKETALREVQEECGIHQLNILKELPNTYHVYNLKGQWALKCTWWYLMQYSGTETPVPQLDEDITEVRWFDINNLFIPFSNTYKSIADLVLKGFLRINAD